MKTTITANSQTFEITPNQPLSELLAHMGLALDQVVVELNKEALTPSEAQATQLQANDSLEIVKIVAGG